MQNNGINFTSYEKCIMKDSDFLLAKREITLKITEIFNVLAKSLGSEPFYKSLSAIMNINFQGAKISKGENYRGLPYLVLDHPRFFDKDDIFTFRSMFWWGHGYSFTLHAQGKFMEHIKSRLSAEKLSFTKPTFISAGVSPWEYNYEEDNYKLIDENNINELLAQSLERGFLKLSRRLETDATADEIIKEGLASFNEFAQNLMF